MNLFGFIKGIARRVNEANPDYLKRQAEKQFREEAHARKRAEEAERRCAQVMQFVASLPTTPLDRLRSMHAYDDPSIAPYYKCKSRFFNERYLLQQPSDERLAEYLRSFLLSEGVRAEKRQDHLFLVSGRQSDFYERCIFRVGEHEFACVEWWHHDWDAPAVNRGDACRDDFHWHDSQQENEETA